MRLRTSVIAALGVLAVGLSTANAAIIVNDNFETYTSQANFEATWIPVGTTAPISAEWSTLQASSPTHSVRNPGTATNNQYRNRRTHAESGSTAVGDQVVWSFDFFDTFNAAPNNPQRNFANLQNGTAGLGANDLISMGLNNNQLGVDSGGQFYMARILSFSHSAVDPEGGPNEIAAGTTSGAYFKLNDPGAPGRTAGWHNLKVIMSNDGGGLQDFRFYVDNTLAETVLNVAGGLKSWENITLGSGLGNSSTQAFFDNVYLEHIPATTPPVLQDHNELGVAAGDNLSLNLVTLMQTGGNPATTWALSNFTYIAAYGGSSPNGQAGAAVNNSGTFTWNTPGSTNRGIYQWDVTAANGGGSDIEQLRVHVEIVPEPAAFSLMALALVGILGAYRRNG